MLPGSILCPGEGDCPDPYRVIGRVLQAPHWPTRDSTASRGNYHYFSWSGSISWRTLWSRKLWSHLHIHACMSVHMSKDNQPQRLKTTATLKNNKTLSSASRKRQRQMIRESKKARETEIKRKNQGEDDFLSTKQQGQILVHLIGNVSFVCKHRLEPALISQIKAF